MRNTRPQASARRHYPRRPHPVCTGAGTAPSPACSRHRAGRAALPRHPRGHAQRVGLWPRLAHRPPGRARPGPGCHRARASPLRLGHAALSLWLNASGEPAEVAARAGNSTRVLHEVYLHCIDGKEDLVSQRIEDALDADLGSRQPSQCVKASGYTHRRPHPRPCPLCVREPVPGPAHSPRDTADGPRNRSL